MVERSQHQYLMSIQNLEESIHLQTVTYPVILYLCELIVDESGLDYGPLDEIVIEPDMGANTRSLSLIIFGRLISSKLRMVVKVSQQDPKFTSKLKQDLVFRHDS